MKLISIGELERLGAIREIQDGNHGELHPKSAEYVKSGIPFVMASNIRDGRLLLDACEHLPKSRADSLRIGFALSGDVLLTHKGTVGEVALVPDVPDYLMLTPQVTYYRTEESKLSNRYLAFAFRSTYFKDQLGSISAQSTRPYVGITAQRQLKIQYRELPEQRRIASILSAYDDLIENNTRRIAILEEMARCIYEEWFVRFRFPGHEGVRMVESELGLVPAGWEIVAATQAMEINPTTKVPKVGLKPFLPMSCLSDGSMLIGGPGEREGNSGSKFRNGDTLFARITPCLENGKTGFVQFLPDDEATAFGSTEFIILRSRTLTPEFVYLLARSEPFRENAIKSMSGASGRQRVREACFDSFLLAQPNRDTLSKFESMVRPMFKLVQTLALKNINLRTTRDLLLPKLISGELDVSAMPAPESIAA